jgi:hypothetical protein
MWVFYMQWDLFRLKLIKNPVRIVHYSILYIVIANNFMQKDIKAVYP